MFSNLIESSSHVREFKRRGSFFLFTTFTYIVMFAVAGVFSIYAYDAQLEEPASEITMLSPLDYQPPAPAHVDPVRVRSAGNNTNVTKRVEAMASVNRPDLVPKATSIAPNRNPPVPDRGQWELSNTNSEATGPFIPGSRGGDNGGNGSNSGTPSIDVGTPPVPPPAKKDPPKIIHKRVLNGEAISLPKPIYPPIAKQMGAQGAVVVQVLVDEAGIVVSAKVVSGNPVLVNAAQRAAMQAKFSPTLIGDQPVKVSGMITYNFILQ